MNTSVTAPVVFVSHASEDKSRFVESFARRLRENGVDAWLDQWEISPGDDLPRRIFEEGIKNANSVIVVLSPHFVRKPWPQQELSASLMRRIYGDIKIIPVVIEQCEVPQSLQSTLWVRIDDLSSYDVEFGRILRSIFDAPDKPPIGNPPAFAARMTGKIPGLTVGDTQLLNAICELSLSSESMLIGSAALDNLAKSLSISQEDAIESIHILEDRHLIKPSWTFGNGLPSVQITIRGFEIYGKYYVEGFSTLVDNVLVVIMNNNLRTAAAVAKHLSQPQMLIEYVLRILDDRKLIGLIRAHGGAEGTVIHEVTPLGRRRAAEISSR